MIWEWIAGAWAGQTLVPPMWLRRRTWRKPRRPEVALTFDDGPDPRYTPQVLDILAREGVQATFFLVGRKAERHPELVRAIVEGGHDLGNHSWNHVPPWLQTAWGAYRDHMKTNRVIAVAAGALTPPPFARAPWGLPNLGEWWGTLRSGQRYVHWTVHAYDWRPGVTPAEIERRVMEQASPGGVVLLHDGTGYPGDPAAMIQALPEIIHHLREHYAIVPLQRWFPSVRPSRPGEPGLEPSLEPAALPPNGPKLGGGV